MITENIAIAELAKVDAEAAWKALSRIYTKSDAPQLTEAIHSLPSQIFSFPEEGETKYRDIFLGKLLKNAEVGLLETLLAQSSDPQQMRKEIQLRHFGNICESRDEGVVNLIFPQDAPIEFDHKHWTTAVLRKNLPLLERMNFPVEPRRALILIENYFFDLQLAQLKYLEPHIPADQWPMRFAADSIYRCKGPGVIGFFIDHGFRSSKLSHGELWDSLASAIKAGNAKAFHKLVDGADKAGFDWAKTGPTGDIPLGEEGSEVHISSSKVPIEIRKSSLLEIAILRGDVMMAQDILERASVALSEERYALWEDSVKSHLKAARAPTDKIKLVLAKMRAAQDISAMQQAAAPSAKGSPQAGIR